MMTLILGVVSFSQNAFAQCSLNPNPGSVPQPLQITVDLGGASSVQIDQAGLSPDVTPLNPGCVLYAEDPNNPGTYIDLSSSFVEIFCDGGMPGSGTILSIFADDDGTIDPNEIGRAHV